MTVSSALDYISPKIVCVSLESWVARRGVLVPRSTGQVVEY